MPSPPWWEVPANCGQKDKQKQDKTKKQKDKSKTKNKKLCSFKLFLSDILLQQDKKERKKPTKQKKLHTHTQLSMIDMF